jgi:hypothetical protein
MSCGDYRRRPWLKATCFAYLLGSAVGLLHPLSEDSALEAGAAGGPATVLSLSQPCSGPSCPDPAHRHHHRPLHDPVSCVVCQFHLLDGAMAACGEAPVASSPTGKVPADPAAPPCLTDRSTRRARSPPAA